mmetsp:Transcript_5062/g.18425  ORF Transcript_5062/g.18425 Transcript_5062/m.18425 type:complete len:80 (-) Transcript_5062:88-327(-)
MYADRGLRGNDFFCDSVSCLSFIVSGNGTEPSAVQAATYGNSWHVRRSRGQTLATDERYGFPKGHKRAAGTDLSSEQRP